MCRSRRPARSVTSAGRFRDARVTASAAVHVISRGWIRVPASAARSEDALLAEASGEFMAAMVFRTLALYAVAAIAWGLSRARGGTGTARETRAAWFWSALIAGPVGLAAALVEIAITPLVPAMAATAIGQAGVAAYALAAATTTAEVHGFRHIWTVLAAIVAAVLAILSLPLLFGA